MSMWKRAMDYLGLGPEDAYDDYDSGYEPERGQRPHRPVREDAGRTQRREIEHDTAPRAARPVQAVRDADVTVRRPSPAGDDSSVQPRPIASRQAGRHAAGGETLTVRPTRFNDVQQVADRFKLGSPVLINFEAAPKELKRRVLDFVSGLCYALGGTIEQVASGVYLLKPRGMTDHAPTD